MGLIMFKYQIIQLVFYDVRQTEFTKKIKKKCKWFINGFCVEIYIKEHSYETLTLKFVINALKNK